MLCPGGRGWLCIMTWGASSGQPFRWRVAESRESRFVARCVRRLRSGPLEASGVRVDSTAIARFRVDVAGRRPGNVRRRPRVLEVNGLKRGRIVIRRFGVVLAGILLTGILLKGLGAGGRQAADLSPIDERGRLENSDEIAALISQAAAELRVPFPLPGLLAGGSSSGYTVQARDVVHLWVLVDESGRATRSRLDSRSESSGFGPAVLEAVSRMRFEPAKYRGEAVAAWHKLPVLVL